MATIIKSRYDYGQVLFMKRDPEQRECTLLRITGAAGGVLAYEIRIEASEEIIEVHDFEVSDKKDVLKALSTGEQSDND